MKKYIILALVVLAAAVLPRCSLAAHFQIDTNGTLTNGLISYYNMEGNSNDYWGSSNASDALITYGMSYGKVGQGALFNGATSSKMLAGFVAPTNAWTYSFWVNPTIFSGGSLYHASMGNVGSNRNLAIYSNGGKVQVDIPWVAGIFTSSIALPTNTWTMVTVTRSGSSWNIYFGTTDEGSATNATAQENTTSTAIGSDNIATAQYGHSDSVDGSIDEFGVWNRALSSQEIVDLYNSGNGQTMVTSTSTALEPHFQVDTNGTLTTGLFSYYPLQGNSHDYWGSNDGADTAITYGRSYGRVNQGALFQSGSVMKMDFAAPTNIWSYSLWINPTDVAATQLLNFSNCNDGVNDNLAVYTNVNGTVQVDIPWITGIMTSNVSLPASAWTMVTVTRNGSSWNLYFGTTTVASASNATTQQNTTDDYIGSNGAGGVCEASTAGDIDEVGMWDKVLSAQEIADLYNGGAGQTMVDATGFSLANLEQYRSDVATAIPESATTTENDIVFGATLQSSGTGTLQLQVEVTTSTSFTGMPTVTSSPSVAPGTYVTSTLMLPPEASANGSYHWQARAIDASGVTSTWFMAGPTPTSTDFIIKTVPLYTQRESIYPSDASTTAWANDLYDNSSTIDCGQLPATSTIAACGCAITDIVMWLRYFGIVTDKLGNTIDPKGLNIWLTNSGGYDSSGDIYWDSIEKYASSTSGSIVFDQNSRNYDGATSSIPSYINLLLNSSTPDPVLLHEKAVGHWVLATGLAQNAGTSTYALRDSNWYNTQYLNQTTDLGNAIKNYNNNIDNVRTYYDPPSPPRSYEYHVNLPNALMLVDSRGRRTGKDPATGVFYHEIPGTGYGEGDRSGQLGVSGLPDGQYTLYVLGGQTGSYWIDAYPPQKVTGNITAKTMDAYTLNFSSTSMDNPKLIFQSAALSTANVTSAPPNNLPLSMSKPPPVVIPVPVPPPSISTSTVSSTIISPIPAFMPTSSIGSLAPTSSLP